MDTIRTLNSKLQALEQQTPDIKYPTGLVIDLRGPQGNIFYLQGVCNRLTRELCLTAEEKEQFAKELEDKDYNSRLDIMQKWFGILFVGRNN